jgi:predicted nicotinamide N-methyase
VLVLDGELIESEVPKGLLVKVAKPKELVAKDDDRDELELVETSVVEESEVDVEEEDADVVVVESGVWYTR